MIYYAHSKNEQDKKHILSDHLNQTAKLIESFACQEDYKPVFHITGLLHDLGKYQPEFQNYLENGGRRGSVPHSAWGAGYARLNSLIEASIAIDGHHKGLPDNSTWKSDTEPYKRGDVPGLECVIKAFNSDALIGEESIKTGKPPVWSEPLLREIFIRYLFSALTDADWLSTEQHFKSDISELRTSFTLPIEMMSAKLEEEFSRKSKVGDLNQMRNEARIQAIQQAELPCGFYSLSLPTGMGKTLISLAWALKHAKKNELKRIIIVLPFINIIDQTAQVLKNLFGEEWVLEHHANYNEDVEEENGEDSPILVRQKKLACENWDYPIIVTTTVQFFESLFSNKPSKCRKNHNIAESVVMFDEVQTLSKEVILPTLQMLKDLQRVMNTSFLFCTATQPAFEKREGFDGIESINPLIKNPENYFSKTKRVRYTALNDLSPVGCDELLNEASQDKNSALVIFNTKKSALNFFDSAKDHINWEKRYHLSTAMCPFHRKAVINKIRADLAEERKVLVVSTQLIEAGVDFDFPVVFREMAPLESIIQSAGRCNRENRLGESGGKVLLFKIEGGGMPDKTYAACAGHAEEFIGVDLDQLHDFNIFQKYYAQIVNLYIDPDKYRINEARGHLSRQFNFHTVNDSYRLISNVTEGMYIYHYNDESRNMFHSIENKEFLSKDDFRRMQAFTVQVYKGFTIRNADMCKVMPQGFMVWFGNYDPDTGVSMRQIDPDKLIV
jgi:CRISPR-associated endonuclease/helicase Cas3